MRPQTWRLTLATNCAQLPAKIWISLAAIANVSTYILLLCRRQRQISAFQGHVTGWHKLVEISLRRVAVLKGSRAGVPRSSKALAGSRIDPNHTQAVIDSDPWPLNSYPSCWRFLNFFFTRFCSWNIGVTCWLSDNEGL